MNGRVDLSKLRQYSNANKQNANRRRNYGKHRRRNLLLVWRLRKGRLEEVDELRTVASRMREERIPDGLGEDVQGVRLLVVVSAPL